MYKGFLFFLFYFFNLILYVAAEEEIPSILPQGQRLDLNLDQILEAVIANNDKILETEDSLMKSGLQITMAKGQFGIQMKPNTRLGYCYSSSKNEPCLVTGLSFTKEYITGQKISVTPNVTTLHNGWNSGLTISFSQPFFRGRSVRYNLNAVDSAKFSYRKAIRGLYLLEVQTILKAITAAYDVLKQEKSYLLAKESSNRLRSFLETSRLKDRLGLGCTLDIYRIEIELKNAEEQEQQALEKLSEVEDQLKELMGISLDTDVAVHLNTCVYKPGISLDSAMEIAFLNRIEIEQSYDNVEEGIRQTKIAKHQTLPEINLVVDYSTSGYDDRFWNFYCCDRSHKWDIGLSTSSDFSRIRELAHYKQSKVALESIERARKSTKTGIELDVRRNIRNYETLWKKIALMEEKVQLAEASLKFAELKYEKALGDNFDIIQAEKNIRTSKIQLYHTMIDYIICEHKLLASLGTLAEKPCL
jgi:outer membrane protein